MASLAMLPSAAPRVPAVARVLSRFDRPQLEGFIAVAIELLDVLDGDVEAEDNGDAEEDGPPDVARLERVDQRHLVYRPADAGEAWNASLRGEDDEGDLDSEPETWAEAHQSRSKQAGPDDAEDDGSDYCLVGDDGAGAVPRNVQLFWGADRDEDFADPPIADPAAYRDQVKKQRRERTYSLTIKTFGWQSSGKQRHLFREPTVPNKRQLLRRKRGVPRHPRA